MIKSIKNFFRWKLVEKDWSYIYNQTYNGSPFQSPEAMKIIYYHFWPYYIKNFSIPLIIIAYDEKNKPCIGGMFIYSLREKNISIIGNETGYNVCGLTYSDRKYIRPYLDMLIKKYREVKWFKIYPNDPLLSYADTPLLPYNGARIIINSHYENYFCSLSKSVRQNIRTAYNRINSDNKSFEFISLDNLGYKQNIDNFLYLSKKRHLERYKKKTSFFKNYFLKYLNFATLLYKKVPYSLSFLLKINGKPAAMMNGLLKNNHYIIPRLAIDSDFKRYSPGIILVNEAIKYLLSNYNYKSLNFDLSFGIEKYKFDMGAELYECYSFKTTHK